MSASSVGGVSRLHVLVRLVFCGLFILYLPGRANAQVSVLPGITTVAGDGTADYNGDDKPATDAELQDPFSVAADSAGNLYIADANNFRIRKVDAAGKISTVAGNGTFGYNGDGGAAIDAQLGAPVGVAVDSAGNLYIADSTHHCIRKMDAAGTITTVAGNGSLGFGGDNGPATSAKLAGPSGVAVDGAGNLYIADTSNHRIRKVDATGTISTVAGDGTPSYGGDNGPATGAQLRFPSGVVLDGTGNLYIADLNNNRIRKVDAATGNISTVAGIGTAGSTGDGGAATIAQLNLPNGVAVDGAGNLYIADLGNQRIRKVDTAGTITTVAATGTAGYSGDGGPATSAKLANPYGVAVDAAGNLYIADTGNQRIRKVTSSNSFPKTAVASISAPQNVFLRLDAQQSITSITAGTSQGGKQEYVVGTITDCVVDGSMIYAVGTICTVPITFAPGYPGGRNVPLKVVTDTGTYSVGLSGIGTGPQVAFTPGIISTVAGNGTSGYSGDAGPATSAALKDAYGVAVDTAGNLYIADRGNQRIRKVDAAGVITTVAGTGIGGDGGPAISALLRLPQCVAVDAAGNLYIADSNDARVRKVDAAGVITTVAGNGTPGDSGDGGPATTAQLTPGGVAVDGAGNLYIADPGNNRIRKVDAAGVISTVAGNGTAGYGGDGGPATSAQLNRPFGVAVDASGNLYIADSNNNRIRKVDAAGTITTVAGNGAPAYGGDGGPATGAQLRGPQAVAVDAAGNLYISDTSNLRIRKVDATGVISTVAGTGTAGYSGDGGPANSAQFTTPAGVAVDAAGNLYIVDFNNSRIRKVDVSTSLIRFNTATNVGSMDTADGPQKVVLSNIGNADLQIPVLSGPNPNISANFTLNACAQIAAPSVLNAGENCGLSVTFAPQVAGSIAGSLVITDSNSVTHTVGLSGTGVAVAPPPPPPPASTFSLSLASGEPGGRAVRVGETATYNLVMTPATSTYPNAISFSVTGLPAGATATFSPSMILAGSATTPFTMAIHTSKNLLAHNGPPTLFGPVVFGFFFIPLFGMGSVRRRVPLMVLTVALSLGAIAGLSGCGGNGHKQKIHSVKVTATDTTTGAQASINVTLTVQ